MKYTKMRNIFIPYNALRRPIANDAPNYSTSFKNFFTCFAGKRENNDDSHNNTRTQRNGSHVGKQDISHRQLLKSFSFSINIFSIDIKRSLCYRYKRSLIAFKGLPCKYICEYCLTVIHTFNPIFMQFFA